jgi:hypothetical protein
VKVADRSDKLGPPFIIIGLHRHLVAMSIENMEEADECGTHDRTDDRHGRLVDVGCSEANGGTTDDICPGARSFHTLCNCVTEASKKRKKNGGRRWQRCATFWVGFWQGVEHVDQPQTSACATLSAPIGYFGDLLEDLQESFRLRLVPGFLLSQPIEHAAFRDEVNGRLSGFGSLDQKLPGRTKPKSMSAQLLAD